MSAMTARGIEHSGFSLLELLIVLTLIGMIAAIAIPRLDLARMAANEAAAISFMRQWQSSQELFLVRNGAYADEVEDLLDSGVLNGPVESTAGPWTSLAIGYRFRFMHPKKSQTGWWGEGRPSTPGTTGIRYFFTDSSGVIRWSTSGPANSSSPALGD